MTKSSLFAFSLAIATTGLANAQADLRLAVLAITAELALQTSPATKYQCATKVCIGVNQAELGLALISAQNSDSALKTMAQILRFKIDASLSEDFNCAAAKKGLPLADKVKNLDLHKARSQCLSDYAEVTRAQAKLFTTPDAVCRSVDQMIDARSELQALLRTKKKCEF